MDISDTLAPNSDQLDAVDLLGGPRTFTVTKVTKGSTEQPVDVHLAEFPRVWRPGKSMRRVLAACWGTDASTWTGRRVTLYCDETVTFGPDVVGGTRISHLSHIDKPRKIPLMVKRGKSATFTVQPLKDEPAPTSPVDVVAEALGGEVIEPMSRVQSVLLGDAFTKAGLTDKSARLTYASDVVGRPLQSATDLLKQEAADVIDALEEETTA